MKYSIALLPLRHLKSYSRLAMKIFHTLGRTIWQEETHREIKSLGQLRHQPGTSKLRAPTWSHNIRKRDSAGWWRVEIWMELTLFPAQAIVRCDQLACAYTIMRGQPWLWHGGLSETELQKRLTHRDDAWVTQVPHMVGGGGLAPPLLSELAIEITAIFGKGFPRWYSFHSSLLGCLEINPNLSLLGFVWASFFLSTHQ